MKYYIIVGEASGDLHASNLIKEIKKIDAKAEIRAWGGDLMEAEGAHIVKHYRDLAFMGFIEVLFNLTTVLRNISFCKKDLIDFQPDILILVDYPGFNLRIAEFAHARGIKVNYYISPQVWAWKKGRVKTIKKVVNKMLVILPFEKDFYKKYGMDVAFVGHPLLDAIQTEALADLDFRDEHNLDPRPIVALLPGSRKQEISRLLNVMLSVVPSFPDYQFVIAGAPSMDESFYSSITGESHVKIVKGQTYRLLQNATAALVTSGTATLETALWGVPEVVCYKANGLSYFIAKRIVDIKYISLVNLIMDREVVKELIQDELNTKSLCRELDVLLHDNEKVALLKSDYKALKNKLGGGGASARAAQLIVGNTSV